MRTPQGNDPTTASRALAEHHRRIAAALRYVLERTLDPKDLAPFIPRAASTLLELLQSEDYNARALIESALAVAEADAAAVAAAAAQLDGAASLARLQRAADDALSEIATIGESSDPSRPIETLGEKGLRYIRALALLADLASREPGPGPGRSGPPPGETA